jgi:hypothetical protein
MHVRYGKEPNILINADSNADGYRERQAIGIPLMKRRRFICIF